MDKAEVGCATCRMTGIVNNREEVIEFVARQLWVKSFDPDLSPNNSVDVCEVTLANWVWKSGRQYRIQIHIKLHPADDLSR